MTTPKPTIMRAAAIDKFGDALTPRTLPVPSVGPDEVLVRIESAGVAPWDVYELQGGFKEMAGEPKFPYILGSDGAGTVAAVGADARRFREGDRVYCCGFLNPKGGLYAEYAAVKADNVSPIPGKLSTEGAGAMPCDAITALRGLDDALGLKSGETVMIFGAGGGIGHLAVQLAKRMGARVFAVASGEDGVALAKRLGADAAVNGRQAEAGGAAAAAREFAPGGLDAALLTAGGEAADRALQALRDAGRVAFPTGVTPEPKARSGVKVQRFDGHADPKAIQKLNRLIESGPFEVHVARTFSLERAADAHRALGEHYLGKLALRTTA